MPLVYAVYLPNAPFLISPAAFDGAGADAVAAIRELRLEERFHPGSVVLSSPHWVSRTGFRVNVSSHPRQIYDFSGFPPSLSAVKYNPPGEPELAQTLVASAQAAGVPTEATQEWGLDHGAWAPLMHLLPEAKTPVVPVSITQQSPETHLSLGRSFRPALAAWPKPVALVATGSILHNFDRFDPRAGARWPEGERIESEILELLRVRDDAALVAFDQQKWNTIQPEGNLGPLFTLLGAVGADVRPRAITGPSVMGGFGMSILEFVPR